MSTPPAVHRQVVVDADPRRAFEVFTAIGCWWPLASHSVLGSTTSSTTVEFVNGQLVERSSAGDMAVWGTVTGWVPGVSVALTWHPGRAPEAAGRLTVTFTVAGTQTLVTLEHSGWDGYDDPAAAQEDHDRGWPRVLGLFRDEVAASSGDQI